MYQRLLVFSLILAATFFSDNIALAGTGQIFSPSGLPQSSTQTYSPPTPGNVPTVSFPAPPLPLGEGVLQSFPGASVPLNNNTQQSGSISISQAGQTTPQPTPTISTNSVQSFFQCPPATEQTPPQTKANSPVKSTGKLLWHVLDNIGVPMFVGKDNDLDPSLKQPYVMPPPDKSSRINIQPAPQKIPQSELEGTDVSPQQDNQPVQLH